VTTAAISSPQVWRAADSDSSSRARLHDIDRAKGLTIILVVIGHIAARDKPSGTDWFALVQFLINSFHMPFFMYLAGYVFFYSGNAYDPRPTYFGYVRRRAERLLIPFLAVGLLIVVGKLSLQAFMHVDNWAGNIGSALRALIWDTSNSPAESIWFVFVLFVYCACVPLLLRLVGYRLWILLTGAAIAYFLAAYLLIVPGYVYLDRISTYLIFFLVGGLVQRRSDAPAFIDRAFVPFAVCFAISLALLAFQVFEDQAFVLCNFLGIPCMHGLVLRVQERRFLLWLSQYTFVIYLLNTVVIGFTMGILRLFLPWNAGSFLLLVPVLGLVGLFGPILIKRTLFRRMPFVDAVTN
jgi:fucose 4-O-acetylase-like acetyltransferase